MNNNHLKRIVAPVILSVLLIVPVYGAETTGEQKTEESVAGVAILKFINNTGSNHYDWLRSSLPDAVYESMLEVFEFKRTRKDWVQGIADEAVGESNTLELSDIRFIAENTSSDIIIYGSYSYDEKSKKITITTRVFHLSRDTITAQIITDSPVDNSLFAVVDKVALQSVRHIEDIALEDLQKQEVKTAAAGEKSQNPLPAKKETGKKIVLKKAAARIGGGEYVYDSWNIGFYGGYTKPYGVLQESLNNTGPFLLGEITSSYGKLFNWGGRFSFISLTNYDSNDLPDEISDVKIFSFQAIGCANFRFFNRIIIQPFFAPGLSSIYTNVKDVGGSEYTNHYYNIILSGGLRVPVRFFGVFMVPFLEYSRIVEAGERLGTFILGLGVTF